MLNLETLLWIKVAPGLPCARKQAAPNAKGCDERECLLENVSHFSKLIFLLPWKVELAQPPRAIVGILWVEDGRDKRPQMSNPCTAVLSRAVSDLGSKYVL